MHAPKIPLRRPNIGKHRRRPDIRADPRDRRRRNKRPDIVQHHALDRAPRRRRRDHPANPPQRRAHPMHRPIDEREQMRQRHHIMRRLIQRRVRQPRRLPTPRQIRTNQIELVRQRRRQRIEIPPVARQPVHANDRMRVRITPRHKGQAMKRPAQQIPDFPRARLRRVHAQPLPRATAGAPTATGMTCGSR